MFSKKKPTPTDLLAYIVQYITVRVSPDQELKQLDDILLNTISADQASDLMQFFFRENVFLLLIKNLRELSFEARKNACILISFVSKRSITGEALDDDQKSPLATYIQSHVEIIDILLAGLDQDIGVNYSSIIKDLLKKQEIVHLILSTLKNDKFYHLIAIMNSNLFEGSSEASVLFKELLTKHKRISLEFMAAAPEFFDWYNQLLRSQNFATKLFTLHLLGDVLLDPDFYPIMLYYVENDQNLKLIMQLLTDVSNKIKVEAFHIFKIFVINPAKPPAVAKILAKNKQKIIQWLDKFDQGGAEVAEEKYMLIEELNAISDEERLESAK